MVKISVPDILTLVLFKKTKNMNGKKILIVGSSNTDMVIKTHNFPAPGETILGGRFLMNAGGKVTDYSGGGDFYSGREVLATNGKLHDEFLKVLGKK